MNTIPLRLVALASLAIAACSRPASDTSTAGSPASATSAAAPAAAPFFEALGRHAENAYDHVRIADWAAARASVDSLTAAMQGAEAQDTAGAGADVRETLASLDSAVGRGSRVQGLRAANHLTEIGARLAAAHDTPVPPGVTLLDYYGRELEIWSEAKETAKLSTTAVAITKTWTELRPRVVARGGSAEAVRFDSVVSRVSAARTPAEYAVTATPVLDEVDALEAVFIR